MIDVPERFREASPKDWPEDHVFRVVIRKYFNNIESNLLSGNAPSFFGVSGTGKSRAAAAIINTANELIVPNVRMSWFPASETFNRLMDFRDMRLTDQYVSLWDRLKNDSLVVFDDIGTLRDAPRIMEYFWIILDSRYSEKKPTIFTGNIELTGTITRPLFMKSMSQWISPAFARRLDQFSSEYLVLI